MQALTAMAGEQLLKAAMKKVENRSKPSSAPKPRRQRKNPRYKKKNNKNDLERKVGTVSSTLAQLDVKNPSKFRNTRLGRNFATGMSAPVSYDSVVCNFEDMFVPKKITHPEYGVGSVVAFSTIVCNVGSNGVPTLNERNFPFVRTTFANQVFMSGFLSTDGNYTTGMMVTPWILGSRMYNECQNWTLWRPRRLQFKFQTNAGTGTGGTLTLAFTRDPSAFIEANSFASITQPPASVAVLTQTVPNTMSNIYRDSILEMTKFPAQPYFIEWADANQFGAYSYGNNISTSAYWAQRCCGRMVGLLDGNTNAVPNSFGYLWCDGEIEFYQPTASPLTIGTTFTRTSLDRNRHVSPIDHNFLCISGTNYFTSMLALCLENAELRSFFANDLHDYLQRYADCQQHLSEERIDLYRALSECKIPAPAPLLWSLKIGSKPPTLKKVSVTEPEWLTIGRRDPKSGTSVFSEEGRRGLDPGFQRTLN